MNLAKQVPELSSEERERGRMMRIVINPNDLSKPERAEERIADLEKQLAEQTTRAATAESQRNEALWNVEHVKRACAEWSNRALAAEKRVAERDIEIERLRRELAAKEKK